MINPATTFAAGQVIQSIKDLASATKPITGSIGQTSLIDVTQAARVEPLTIVGSDCVNLEYMTDVLHSLHSLFTGYYMQAVALTTKVDNVRVIKILEKFSTNRENTLIGAALESFKQNISDYQIQFKHDWRLSSESYKWRLPSSKNHRALEAEQVSVNSTGSAAATRVLNDLSNLSVGKLVQVDIQISKDNIVKIPVSIRLMVNQATDNVILKILSPSKEDTSITERYHAWRSGRISFFKDLILANDLIDEHRKNLIDDKDGLYSKVIHNANKHKLAGLRTANPSLASASNIVVMSNATAQKLEQRIGAKLSNSKARDKIFNSGYAMLIAVIDPQWERVTIYHRGISNHTDLSVRDLKVANKGTGPSVADIMKAYVMGSSPSI